MGSSYQFYSPYKTFLLGEYAVLENGQAIMLATRPGFSLSVQMNSRDMTWPMIEEAFSLHPNCPVTPLWYQAFHDKPFSVSNMCRAKKGFGASGAWMWLVWLIKYFHVHGHWPILDHSFFFEGMTRYRDLYQDFPRLKRPSGADMACQFYGGLSYVDVNIMSVEAVSWPFHNLGFVLIATGFTLLTHQHLASLREISSDFQVILLDALAACQNQDEDGFVRAFKYYQQALLSEGLQYTQTTECIEALSVCPGFVAAKGCGALGAEVICLLYKQEQKVELDRYLCASSYVVIATEEDLSGGLEIS